MMNVISLGAGVQSSTMALMAERGELGYQVDCAIFADTGAEPRAVYEWLDWLEGKLSFPVHRVSKGSLYQSIMSKDVLGGEEKRDRFVSVPFYTRLPGSAREGMTRRQCTREFKLEPIRKKQRELIGLKPRQRGPKEVVMRSLQGISLDEMQRMRISDTAWIENVYPLIEKRITRYQCIEWMKANGYPEPPKSACTFCPYHDDAMWRDMRDNDPASWQQAIEVDAHIRKPSSGVRRGMNAQLYLHKSCVPLDQVDLSTAEDHGQIDFINGFQNECEGMCGV